MADVLDALLPLDLMTRNHGFAVRMEEIRADGTLTLRMEIPGINPAKDVDVCVEEGVLTVSGERGESTQTPERSEFSYGRFIRMVSLPRGADEDSIRASYHEGILEITMDTKAHSGTPRHIAVASGRSPA
jgi:HSP20 family molecular chaperone IbpA